ncbi:hypothetical protein WJS89_03740 [Sphingomicrobium sp. XHP0235]|uniref:hypothetical protein n=1 Tax=Sphingomicrobium aquimarinum TaxID=3133971 RepID=UPI0031FF3388
MEGAIVFASLIVGVALTDLLTSLHRLLRARDRVRWDALPLVFAALVVLSVVMTWWAVAGASGAITIGGFLPTLATLVLIFLLASASLPDADGEGPAAGIDLTAFWARESRYLWGLLFVLIALDFLEDVIIYTDSIGDVAIYFWQRAVDTLLLGAVLAAAVARRRWVDWVVLALMAIGPITWLGRSLG